MASPSPDRTLDCRGLTYPSPILKAEQALAEMERGQLLEVITTHTNTRPDLVAWAEHVEAELLVVTDVVDGQYRFVVRKNLDPTPRPGTDPAPGDNEKLFLVVLTSGFDYTPIVRSALMYASLAAAMGFVTVVYCIQAGVPGCRRGGSFPAGGGSILAPVAEAPLPGVRGPRRAGVGCPG